MTRLASDALVMAERTNDPRKTHLFIKGDFTRHGEEVSPGVPAVLHPLRASPTTKPVTPAAPTAAASTPVPEKDMTHEVTVEPAVAVPVSSGVTWG